MKAYDTSAHALQTLLSHPSLQRDNVDQTMNRLSHALADHAEIENALSIGGELSQQASALTPIDEDELDAELQGLLRAEMAEVPELPPVPANVNLSRPEEDKPSVDPVVHDRVPAS